MKRETFWALQDVTFEVAHGERLGIIGRNGAGKSTLLKILSRVVYPTVGEVRIRGRVTSLLEVGTGFNGNLSGRENIYLNASIHGLTRREIDNRFEEMVEFAGIGPFLDTPVKHYSSGMHMRLAFSGAAHLDPDILLLDEVLAVGDLAFQQKCLQRVDGLVSEGRTVVFVSHSFDSVARFCTRCIWLDRGRVLVDGPVQDVLERYLEDTMGMRSARTWTEPAPALAGVALPSESMTEASAVESAGDGLAPDRPGDEYARLIAARVVNAAGETIASTAVDESVGIEVEYEVLRAGMNVQPALHFKTPTDQYAFVVAFTDPDYMISGVRPGRFRAIAWVPPDLLNVGILHVTVVLVTPDPMVRHCVVERAVSFNVHEYADGTGSARGLFAREFPGPVRPKLRWTTQVIPGPSEVPQNGTNAVTVH